MSNPTVDSSVPTPHEVADAPALAPGTSHAGQINRCRGDLLSAAQLHGLLQLRAQVFVVEQACPYLDPDGLDLLPSTTQLWLGDPDGGTILASLRVLDHDTVPIIGRVCTHAQARGQGLAGHLLDAALELIGPRTSGLNAQAHLADWYARYDFRVVGEPFDEDGIMHVAMRRPAPGE